MGIFKRKIKNPVMGTAQIVQCSQPATQRATWARCDLFVVVEGPGIDATSHELHQQVRVARWPHPGMTLPCRIDANKPERFEIDFDAIADWRDQARSDAASVAASRAGAGGSASASVGMSSGPVTVIGAATPEEAQAGIRKAEVLLGTDLDGDGRIG